MRTYMMIGAAMLAAMLLAACGSSNNNSSSTTLERSGGKGDIAFLLPENQTARYETLGQAAVHGGRRGAVPGLQGPLLERHAGRLQAAAAG